MYPMTTLWPDVHIYLIQFLFSVDKKRRSDDKIRYDYGYQAVKDEPKSPARHFRFDREDGHGDI